MRFLIIVAFIIFVGVSGVASGPNGTKSTKTKIRHYCQDMADAAKLDEAAAARPVLSYFGDFVGEFADGYGIKRDYDGSVYVGAWRAGRRNGYGKQLMTTSKFGAEFYQGDIYQGMWSGGLPHGEGSLITVNGSKLFSVWINGKRNVQSDGQWQDLGEETYNLLAEPLIKIER